MFAIVHDHARGLTLDRHFPPRRQCRVAPTIVAETTFADLFFEAFAFRFGQQSGVLIGIPMRRGPRLFGDASGRNRRIQLFRELYKGIVFFDHFGYGPLDFSTLFAECLANRLFEFIFDRLDMLGWIVCLSNGVEIGIVFVQLGILDFDGTPLPCCCCCRLCVVVVIRVGRETALLLLLMCIVNR